MSAIERRYEWTHEGSDPNDETFGHIVEPIRFDELGRFPAVLVGEPYDGAVIGRKGAAAGPAAIRRALQGVKTHHLDRGPVPPIGDLGDLAIPDDGSVERAQQATAERTAQLHEAATLPVFLGGDNSLTVPNVTPLVEQGSVGVISIDAHLDCRAIDDGVSSGTPYRQLHDRGLDALSVVGARQFETSTTYVDYLHDQGGTIVTAEAVRQDLDAAVETARSGLGAVEQVYVSLDVDAIDGATAPGASAPTPGGLTSREVFAILDACCRDDRLAGIEVVECAPPLDAGEQTVRIASRAVAHALSAALTAGGGDR